MDANTTSILAPSIELDQDECKTTVLITQSMTRIRQLEPKSFALFIEMRKQKRPFRSQRLIGENKFGFRQQRKAKLIWNTNIVGEKKQKHSCSRAKGQRHGIMKLCWWQLKKKRKELCEWVKGFSRGVGKGANSWESVYCKALTRFYRHDQTAKNGGGETAKIK